MTMYSDVYVFHEVFGHPVAEAPGLPEAAVRVLRRRLLSEEVDEYQTAESENDIVAVADALADMAYIICGTAVAYGLGPHGYDAVGLPRVAGSRPSLPGNPSASPQGGSHAIQRIARRARIASVHATYEQAEAADDLAGIDQGLQALMTAILTCADTYNIPLPLVFEAVHRANMAKQVDGKVLRREDGKIIKPADWQPPDIAGVLFATR